MKKSAYVRALSEIMVKHGITEMKVGDVVLVRPTFAALPKDDKPGAGEEPDPLRRLENMSDDERDRALALGPLGSR